MGRALHAARDAVCVELVRPPWGAGSRGAGRDQPVEGVVEALVGAIGRGEARSGRTIGTAPLQRRQIGEDLTRPVLGIRVHGLGDIDTLQSQMRVLCAVQEAAPSVPEMIDDRGDRRGWRWKLVPGEGAHNAARLRSTRVEEGPYVAGVVDAEARTDDLDVVAKFLVEHAGRDCVGLEELFGAPDPEGLSVWLVPDIEDHVPTAGLASNGANELRPLAKVSVRGAATFRPRRGVAPRVAEEQHVASTEVAGAVVRRGSGQAAPEGGSKRSDHLVGRRCFVHAVKETDHGRLA